MKKILLLALCFLSLSLSAVQTIARPARELPPWFVNTYHYGVSPVTTALVLLARAGWFTTKTAAQGVCNVGSFIVNKPVAACLVIPINLVIAYYFYKSARDEYRELKPQFDAWSESLRAGLENWINERRLSWENAEIL